jgi:hypothetical protein
MGDFMCGVCEVAKYSPACILCAVMMLFESDGGWG